LRGTLRFVCGILSGTMRIFVAGATGVIGVRLVPLLVTAGHDVAAMTRSPQKVDSLRALGAHPVVCDVYDTVALREAVTAFRPGRVIHQLTDLPDDRAHVQAFRDANSRIRREGTRNLLAAARAAGAPGILAQSVAWQFSGDAGAATADLERMVLEAGGVVLRYGQFYGPGTYHETAPPPPRIHIDEAARRTVDALAAPTGVIVIVS
jgi:nucleoside-diphosphate-sugar epimerase